MKLEREQLVPLVTAAKNGDGDAINTLFNNYYDDVYRYAKFQVHDDDLASEITQESFVTIITDLPELREPAAFVSWMRRIVDHQCSRYYRKKKDVLVGEDEDGHTIFDDLEDKDAEFIPDEALDRDELKRIIEGILDGLPEEQRAATYMFYFEEMKIKDIAQILDIPENTVKSRLAYSRKAIKEAVEKYERKNNIKLHAFPFIPMLRFVFGESPVGSMPLAAAESVASGITAATGTSISVGASAGAAMATATGTTAAASTAVTAASTAGFGAKIAALPIAIKVTAVALAATVTVGGTAFAVIEANKNDTADNENHTDAAATDSVHISSEYYSDGRNDDPTASGGRYEQTSIPDELNGGALSEFYGEITMDAYRDAMQSWSAYDALSNYCSAICHGNISDFASVYDLSVDDAAYIASALNYEAVGNIAFGEEELDSLLSELYGRDFDLSQSNGKHLSKDSGTYNVQLPNEFRYGGSNYGAVDNGDGTYTATFVMSSERVDGYPSGDKLFLYAHDGGNKHDIIESIVRITVRQDSGVWRIASLKNCDVLKDVDNYSLCGYTPYYQKSDGLYYTDSIDFYFHPLGAKAEEEYYLTIDINQPVIEISAGSTFAYLPQNADDYEQLKENKAYIVERLKIMIITMCLPVRRGMSYLPTTIISTTRQTE